MNVSWQRAGTCRHKAGTWQTKKANGRQGLDEHTRRTHGGRNQGGHKADNGGQTHGGQAPGRGQGISRPAFFPKQSTVGFSLRKKGWPRYALAASPELVLGRASRPCRALVRGVSATCPPYVRLWPRIQALSRTCPSCVRRLSALCCWLALAAPSVLVRHLSARCLPMSAFIVSGSASLYVHLCPGLFVCRFRRSRFLKRRDVMRLLWGSLFAAM